MFLLLIILNKKNKKINFKKKILLKSRIEPVEFLSNKNNLNYQSIIKQKFHKHKDLKKVEDFLKVKLLMKKDHKQLKD